MSASKKGPQLGLSDNALSMTSFLMRHGVLRANMSVLEMNCARGQFPWYLSQELDRRGGHGALACIEGGAALPSLASPGPVGRTWDLVLLNDALDVDPRVRRCVWEQARALARNTVYVHTTNKSSLLLGGVEGFELVDVEAISGHRAHALFRLGGTPCRTADGARGEPCSKQSRARKVALYTYNFGNYRDEIGGVLYSKRPMYKEYDHFLFTDVATVDRVKLERRGWKVVILDREELVAESGGSAASVRALGANKVAVKWLKFGPLRKELASYKWVIHIDSSYFGRNPNGYRIPPYKELKRLFERHRSVNLFLYKHPNRWKIPQEWEHTLAQKLEDHGRLQAFRARIYATFGRDRADAMPLFALGMFVRKVNDASSLDRAMRATFDAMLRFQIRRDQNVNSFMLFAYLRPSAPNRTLPAFPAPFKRSWPPPPGTDLRRVVDAW